MTINSLFETAVKKNASDLQLAVGKSPIVRIDGELVFVAKTESISQADMEKMVYSILTPSQKEKFLKEKDLDFSYEISDGSRFRVNVFFEKDNVGLAARVIASKIPTMEDIGMPQVVYEMTRARQGLILVTGPTCCGKSTSLAAMIDLINSERTSNIITLEDPVEFLFESEKSIIAQRQLGTDMVSFAKALKHVLRQDPDVIMVGEMRDLETIAATITLAETGHLVLATLHTYSAAQTVDRIIDIFPPYQQAQVKQQLSGAISMIISQRLVPKVKGGRVAAREVLINTPAVANLIRENKLAQISTVIETNNKIGMVSMDKALKNLYKDGVISKGDMELYSTDITL